MGKKTGLGVALLFAISLTLGFASAQSNQGTSEVVARAKVIEVTEYEEITDDWFYTGRQLVTVEIMSGRFKGNVEILENNFTGVAHRDLHLETGDQVLLLLELDGGRLQSVSLREYGRDRYLYIVIGLFIIVFVLATGLKGLKTILSLAGSGLALFLIVLPAVLKGAESMGLTILTAVLAGALSALLFGGLTLRAAAAIVGTTAGLLAAWACTGIFGAAAKLTGLGGDIQTLFLGALPASINLRALLYVGIIFGVLGALVELSLTISASVIARRGSDSLLSIRALFKEGFRAGRAGLARMVNMYVLAVLGCSLPLFMLLAAGGMSYLEAVNLGPVATEVIRALAGGFGLLAVLPATAYAAALLAKKYGGRSPVKDGERQ